MNGRGMTLVETLVACALLAILAGGLGGGLLLARDGVRRAEQASAADAAVRAQMAVLLAVPWESDAAGVAVAPAVLTPTASDSLRHNTAGAFAAVDAAGAPLDPPLSSTPAFAVRWRIAELGGPDIARLLDVCVFAWPASDAATPLVCGGAIRRREP
ncbi:MAG: prepilin-type N-terminal cleavage/methylation domain-containing protein [Acidobacteria bacterium]|nr:prepilin-type N-terminal cleavage/methylation domain-containing protein [Acidobacteriota bacterium]